MPKIPIPQNEPVQSFAPGSPEREELKRTLRELAARPIEIPLIIGGKEVRTGQTADAVMPHCHHHVLAKVHQAGPQEIAAAVAAARAAWSDWARTSLEERAAVFLKAADLLAGKYRATVNAATMLGQSKTSHQAEIDAACELIDFFRFNAHFAERIHAEQPLSAAGTWNLMDYRPLEGFVYAISPFNFTSIGGNLSASPAMMGTTVVWKPAATAVYSNYFIMKLLLEAGLPPGVINFLPGPAAPISAALLADRHLGGIHFTGSTEVFQSLWETVSRNLRSYRDYPRLVGETGGKDFIIAHRSADPQELAVAMARGAFEYQGQKCSAASRIYVPKSLWPEVKDRVTAMMREIKVGDVADFRTFMGAVIDRKSFEKIFGYLEDARKNATIIEGGTASDAVGYFVSPTLVQAGTPDYRLMCEEIFGPVVTTYVYDDAKWSETLSVIDRTSPYALTGAVFSRDRAAIGEATSTLRNAAGNFYINDKPTGAVVGQQPFGGARASGTNDKAGSKINLLRWVSARTMKETFSSPRDYRYPYMSEE